MDAAKHFVVLVRRDVTVMQSGNDCAIRERELPFAIGFDRDVVSQDGTQTVEVACFMRRGNPLPVAVSVRNFGNEVCGGFPIRASWCRGNEGGGR